MTFKLFPKANIALNLYLGNILSQLKRFKNGSLISDEV
jgi:hypothetical protein